MHIRRAIPSDFPILATFSVDAFINDELYQFTNPHVTKYPDDFRESLLRRLKQRNATLGYITWVAVEDGSDGSLDGVKTGEPGEIVGYAMWRRYGDSERAKAWQKQSWAQCMEWEILSRACFTSVHKHSLRLMSRSNQGSIST